MTIPLNLHPEPEDHEDNGPQPDMLAVGSDFVQELLRTREPPWFWRGGCLHSMPTEKLLGHGPARPYKRKIPGWWPHGWAHPVED